MPNMYEHRSQESQVARNRFFNLLPKRPLATDRFAEGLWCQSKPEAARSRYLQPNPVGWHHTLIFDIDHEGAATAHLDGILPTPNFIVLNADNGRGHNGYFLKSPVPKTDASRRAPIRFLASIERGITRRLDADPAYVGLVCKNPLHPSYRTRWLHDHEFTLPELAESLHRANMAKQARVAAEQGLGRNVAVFDSLRTFAYREVLKFKRDGAFAEYKARLLDVARGINSQFAALLSEKEIAAIRKSIAGWTWDRFSDEKFVARQAHLGVRSGKRLREISQARADLVESLYLGDCKNSESCSP